MTTEPMSESAIAPEQPTRLGNRGDIAFRFARQIAGFAEHRRGDLADIRRMDPDEPDAAAFWRLMAGEDLLGIPALEIKWALILHGIALMTPTNRGEGNPRSAHDGNNPVGRALYLGGDPQRRERGYYSETRLNRLLTARGPMLRTLLARMFRMLASADVSFNWREMSQLILNDSYNEEAAERNRRGIARAYYQAQRRQSQVSQEQ